jgi:hypothetical protein
VILSKREKMIAYVTGGAIGLFALNYIAVEPLMAHRDQLTSKVTQARTDLANAHNTVERGKLMNKKWTEMTKAGLGSDTSTAEAKAQNALNAFADDSRLSLTSNKPERTERVKQLHQITIRVSAQGSLASIGRFLYRIQTSEIPARVTDFQLNARKEGADDLTLTLGVSTIALAPPETKPKPGARSAAGAGAAQTGGTR